MVTVTVTMLVMMVLSHELFFLKIYPVFTKNRLQKRPGGYQQAASSDDES